MPASEIFNEIDYINTFIKKYPNCKILLNSRLNFLQNKIIYINKYTYMCGSGSVYYNYYDSEIMNWSKEKLENTLNELENSKNVEISVSLINEKDLIRKVIKERNLKDFIENHLKMKYTKKIVKDQNKNVLEKDDDYELVETNF